MFRRINIFYPPIEIFSKTRLQAINDLRKIEKENNAAIEELRKIEKENKPTIQKRLLSMFKK